MLKSCGTKHIVVIGAVSGEIFLPIRDHHCPVESLAVPRKNCSEPLNQRETGGESRLTGAQTIPLKSEKSPSRLKSTRILRMIAP